MKPARMAAIHASAMAPQRPWSAAEFSDLLSDSTVMAATDPDGFGLIRVLGPEAELLTLAVAQNAQRKGIGRRLLAQLIGLARNAGAGRMMLEVSTGNTAAQALYATAGFTQIALRKAYYRYPGGGAADALIMDRRIDATFARDLP